VGDPMVPFIVEHQTQLALGAAWIFSALMSTMPEVDPTKLPFLARWAYSFVQFLAANLHKT
jgi:hypothetical protein